MNHLLILNDPPYGSERSYNGLRLARSLLKAGEQVRVFLIGDAAACAMAGQRVPPGYYNLGDLLGMVVRAGGEVSVCGSCMDARGIAIEDLISGAGRGTIDVLTGWTRAADQVIAF